MYNLRTHVNLLENKKLSRIKKKNFLNPNLIFLTTYNQKHLNDTSVIK
jgi:hypothetical protein